MLWKATEHNADVYAAFINLYLATNDPAWRARAMAAKSFLRAMWNEQDGFFWTGTTEDGATINPSPVPEDAQSGTLLVLGEPERYARALQWAEAELYSPAYPQCAAGGGYRFAGCADLSEGGDDHHGKLDVSGATGRLGIGFNF